MNWWLSQPSRGIAEQVGLADLAENFDWLGKIKWSVGEDLHLMVDFEINHLGNAIPLRMTFPKFFPDVPPQVAPKEEIRLSGHQYGVGGELCLEYRPDNWEPQMTGAMMVESAYRLLTGEKPTDGETARVESAHRSTIGQDVRRDKYRALFTPELISFLQSLNDSEVYSFFVEEHFHALNFILIPKRIGSEETPLWTAGPTIRTIFSFNGYVICIPDSLAPLDESYNYLLLTSQALRNEQLKGAIESNQKESFFLLRHKEELMLLSLSAGTGERVVKPYKIIKIPSAQLRLPEGYSGLDEKSVAIVGCGSIGSKIAVSLARTGVSKFVLVDGDLLFPGNLVRNELDGRAIGLNKPDALEARILEIIPSASIQKRRILIGGQESSTLTDATLNQISECDLIVDATANPNVFNLTASIAKTNKKPLVWGVIYAGGIGGLVARARPDIDPPPHIASRQITKWCDDQNTPWKDGYADNYDLSPDDAPPMIADDADVTIISSHMTRFATDILVRQESIFPSSVYLIGLQSKWIFRAPFDTCPIDLIPEGAWGRDIDPNVSNGLTELVAKLFPNDNPKE